MFSGKSTAFAALAAVALMAAGCQTTTPAANAEQACLQDDDIDLAISSCSAIIEAGQASGDLDYVWAYVSRGDSYQQKGNMALALADYDTALDLDPDNTDAFYNRGRWHAENGDHQRAIRDFDQSARYSPDEADVYNERGLSWAGLGDHDRAFADFEKSLALDPGYHFAVTNRGFSHQATGNPEMALRDWENGIRMGGKEEVLWWQDYLREAKVYGGATDGEDTQAFRTALAVCSRDPGC